MLMQVVMFFIGILDIHAGRVGMGLFQVIINGVFFIINLNTLNERT